MNGTDVTDGSDLRVASTDYSVRMEQRLRNEIALLRQEVREKNRELGLRRADVDSRTEILRMLPPTLVAAYEALWLASAGCGADGSAAGVWNSGEERGRLGRATGGWNGSTSRSGPGSAHRGFQKGMTGGTVHKKGGGPPPSGMMLDGVKDRADRKLRRIAREVMGTLRAMEKGDADSSMKPRRCTGKQCRRWGEPDWTYCPNCGADMEMGSESRAG